MSNQFFQHCFGAFHRKFLLHRRIARPAGRDRRWTCAKAPAASRSSPLRRASSRVSRLVAERRCDAAKCPKLGLNRKCLVHVRNDANDPSRHFAAMQHFGRFRSEADIDRTALMPGSILLAGPSCLTKITCYMVMSYRERSCGRRYGIDLRHASPRACAIGGFRRCFDASAVP